MDDGSGEMNTGRTVTAPAELRLDDATHPAASRLVFPKVETHRPFHVRATDRSLNVSLITEGTYPFHDGGVSVWCDQIVRGLAPDRFHIDAITAGLDDTACWMFPENVVEVRRIPLWGPSGRRRPALRLEASLRQALRPFLLSIATDDADGAFRPSLELLAVHARDGRLADALCSNEAVELTLEAMRSTPVNRRLRRRRFRPGANDRRRDQRAQPAGTPAAAPHRCSTRGRPVPCVVERSQCAGRNVGQVGLRNTVPA